MKRRISLLLAVVMVLGSFGAVFATDVSTTEEAAAQFLNERDILLGNTSGDLALDEYMKRQDSVIMLSRLMGEEDAAEGHVITEAVKAFKDVKNPYYRAFISWAVEKEYFKGKTPTKFGNDEDITARDYAVVLLRALGYGEEVATGEGWKNAFETATKLGLLKDLELKADDKIRRGQMAVMTVNALNTKVNDGDKTLAEELGIDMSMPVGDVEVKVKNEREIEVKFANSVSVEDQKDIKFVVTNDKDRVENTKVEFAKDGKSAVVSRTSGLKFREGVYTVEVKGIEEEVKEEVEITKSKAQAIEIKENVVVNDKDNPTKLTVEFVDQYGERKAVKYSEISAYAAIDNKEAGEVKIGTNFEITFANNDKVKEGDVVTVTIVNTNDPLNVLQVTKELEVNNKPVVVDMELSEPIIVKKDKLVDEVVSGDDSVAYIKIEAQDQYGEKVDHKGIEAAKLDIMTNAEKSELYKATAADKNLEKDASYIKLSELNNTDTKVKTVSVYLMSVQATGVQTSNAVSLDIQPARAAKEIADIKVDKSVLEKDAIAKVEVKILDQYGDPVKDAKVNFVGVKVNNGVEEKATDYFAEKNDVETDAKGIAKVELKALKSGDASVKVFLGTFEKPVASEVIDFEIVSTISGYVATTKSVEDLTAGKEVSINIEAQKTDEGETVKYEDFSGKKDVVVNLDGTTKFLRKGVQFNKGEAVVTVPVEKAGTYNDIKLDIDNKDITVNDIDAKDKKAEITVVAGSLAKYELTVGEGNVVTVKAVDEFNNPVEDVKLGKKIVKVTTPKGVEVEGAFAEGEVELTDGATFTLTGAGKGNVVVEYDGIKGEVEVNIAE